jgi:membrane-associated phospholipid phosphatase
MTLDSSFDTSLDSPLPQLPMTRDRKVARWISRVSCPPVLAVIGTLAVAAEVGNIAWMWALFMIALSIVVPALYVLWLTRHGKVTDFDIYLRQQRFWPYVVGIACSAIAWLVMAIGRAPHLFILLSGASVGQEVVMFLVNQRWKISAHASSTASFAVLIWRILGAPATPVLLIIPLVAWSRVRLGRHTKGQVVAGSLLGASIFISILVLI